MTTVFHFERNIQATMRQITMFKIIILLCTNEQKLLQPCSTYHCFTIWDELLVDMQA
jgi:hypothetical protein